MCCSGFATSIEGARDREAAAVVADEEDGPGPAAYWLACLSVSACSNFLIVHLQTDNCTRLGRTLHGATVLTTQHAIPYSDSVQVHLPVKEPGRTVQPRGVMLTVAPDIDNLWVGCHHTTSWAATTSSVVPICNIWTIYAPIYFYLGGGLCCLCQSVSLDIRAV